MTALIDGWMLQKTRTTPCLTNCTDFEVRGAYRPTSNIWPLKLENALWKIGSALGKSIHVPARTGRTCGVNILFFCSMTAWRDRGSAAGSLTACGETCCT